MKTMRNILIILLLVSSNVASAGQVTVGTILLDTRSAWMSEVLHGMRAAADKLDVSLNTADARSSLARESSIVNNYIAQQVDAVAWMPQSDKASAASYRRLLRANIPVVLANTRVNDAKNIHFVGVDNTALGKHTGERAVAFIRNKMNGTAKLAVVGNHRYSVGMQRVKGFLREVTSLKGVTIVAQQDAEFREKAYSAVENILQAHPDTDLIWCWNLPSTLGAYAAIRASGLNDVVLMGTDMSIEVARYMLRENTVLKVVTTQQPNRIGYTSIKNAKALAEGQSVPKKTLIPLQTFTSDQHKRLHKYINARSYLIK